MSNTSASADENDDRSNDVESEEREELKNYEIDFGSDFWDHSNHGHENGGEGTNNGQHFNTQIYFNGCNGDDRAGNWNEAGIIPNWLTNISYGEENGIDTDHIVNSYESNEQRLNSQIFHGIDGASNGNEAVDNIYASDLFTTGDGDGDGDEQYNIDNALIYYHGGDRFLQACRDDDAASVNYFIEQNVAVINTEDDDGWTSLIVASIYNRIEILKILVRAGAVVNLPNMEGARALSWACQVRSWKCFRLLLDLGAEVNYQDMSSGFSPIMAACEVRFIDAVRILIAAGADVDLMMEDGSTCLMLTAWNGHTDILLLLIGAGADINRVSESGQTALMYAATFGHDECLEALLEAGADVNMEDIDGCTALTKASGSGNRVAEKLLLDNGANESNGSRCVILDNGEQGDQVCYSSSSSSSSSSTSDNGTITSSSNTTIASSITECTAFSIHSRMDINKTFVKKIKERSCALAVLYSHSVKRKREHSLSKDFSSHDTNLLLTASPKENISDRDAYGNTALHHAISIKDSDMVSLLLSSGADKNSANNRGQTPMHAACMLGQFECVDLLLNNNCRIEDVDDTGSTPLWWAVHHRHLGCVKLLLSRGANVFATKSVNLSAPFNCQTSAEIYEEMCGYSSII
jgi:uncharacterized protein